MVYDSAMSDAANDALREEERNEQEIRDAAERGEVEIVETDGVMLVKPKFDPSKRFMSIRSRGGATDYLQVKDRVLWFRDSYPQGTINTEVVKLDLEGGFALFKCTATTGEGGEASDYGSETEKDFTDYIEKASTKATGRALALLGFSTGAATDFDLTDAQGYEHTVDTPEQSNRTREVQRQPHWERPGGGGGKPRDTGEKITERQVKFANALLAQTGTTTEELGRWLHEYGTSDLGSLTKAQAGQVINRLNDIKNRK